MVESSEEHPRADDEAEAEDGIERNDGQEGTEGDAAKPVAGAAELASGEVHQPPRSRALRNKTRPTGTQKRRTSRKQAPWPHKADEALHARGHASRGLLVRVRGGTPPLGAGARVMRESIETLERATRKVT